jgi:hypothetical protein
LFALGYTGLAGVATVQQQPMVRFGNDGFGDVFDELLLAIKWILGIGG